MREAAERWLTFAEEDLRAAEILFREGVWNQVCFHAQQCVEKALKGLCVLQRQQPPPRTHAIVDLLELVPREWLSDIRLALAESIDTYYIPTRYPDALPGTLPEGLPGREEADEAVRLARQVIEESRGLLAR